MAMGTTGIGQMLLKSFSLDCPGNRMSSGERLVRLGKVLNRQDTTATGTGLRIDAEMRTEDSRSQAPNAKWNTWLAMKPYPDEGIPRAAKRVRGLPAYQSLVRHNTDPAGDECKVLMTPSEVGRAKHVILDVLRARRATPARTFAEAGCTCPDYYDGRDEWCKHIAALGILLTKEAETKPGAFLDAMGVKRTSPTWLPRT